MNISFFLIFITNQVITQEEENLNEILNLNFKIINTDIKDQITDGQGGKLTAPKGFKLIVIKLKVIKSTNLDINLTNSSFAVIYPYNGEKKIEISSAIANGIESHDLWFWAIPSVYGASATSISLNKNHEIFKIGFVIPNEISRFIVCTKDQFLKKDNLINTPESTSFEFIKKIGFCSLEQLSKITCEQNCYYIRFSEVKMLTFQEDKETYQGSVYFGDEVKLLQNKDDLAEILSLESGWHGWVSDHLITKNYEEIVYFKEKQLIPKTGILLSINNENEKTNLLINPLCGAVSYSKKKGPIPIKGTIVFFDKIKDLDIFRTEFNTIDNNAIYFYDGKRFEELVSDPPNGFKINRILYQK